MFEFISKHSILWLSLYSTGSVLVIALTAGSFGGGAAGTLSGFLVLGGVIGYETLTRLRAEKKINGQMATLNVHHDRLTREVARSRGEIDGLKDDMIKTAELLKKQSVQKPEPTIGESIGSRIQQTLQKMGTKPRATVTDTAKKYEHLLMMRESKINEDALNAQDDVPRMRAPRPNEYSDAIVSELLHHAVHNDRIEIFAQPIVRLPARKLCYLELFGRIRARAGVYLGADRYRDLAEKETLMADVDHLLLMHALDSIRADARRGVEIGYFLNVSATSFRDQAFMGDLLEFAKRNRDLTQYLIFEMTQADMDNLSPALLTILPALSKVGCRFSVDNIGNPNVDMSRMKQIGVEFVKIDAQKIITLMKTTEGEAMMTRLKTRLESMNITMIAEKMEQEREVVELLDFNVELAEGHLFGKPDLEVAYRPKKSA